MVAATVVLAPFSARETPQRGVWLRLGLCFLCLCVPACSKKESLPGLSVGVGGPDLEVRIQTSPALSVVLPRGARILELSGERLLAKCIVEQEEDGEFALEAVGDGISLAGQVVAGPLEIEPPSDPPLGDGADRSDGLGGLLGVASGAGGETPPARFYRGRFVVALEGGQLCLSNKLSLEEYLAGVIGSEMPAGSYPLEALKAQAVAARTYALYAVLDARERGRPTRFAGDERFQVYKGKAREHPRALLAVRETVGEVLTYEGSLFRSYFHSTCGGKTADASTVFEEPDIPPLRGTVCGTCGHGKYARWKVGWTAGDIAEALRPWLTARKVVLGEIEELIVADRHRNGRVRYVLVRHKGGSFEIQGNRLRALLRSIDGVGLRSTYFEVKKEGSAFVFEGGGWGHGVGMCQVGAEGRGKTEGYREILEHYYPESRVASVY